MSNTLTKEELAELARHGLEYPWMPQVMLERLRRLEQFRKALGTLHRAAVTHPCWITSRVVLGVTCKLLTEAEQKDALK